MSWGPRHSVSHPELVEMERLIEDGLKNRPGMGLCIYDPREFTLAEIEERAHHHSLVAGPGRVRAPSLQILETARGLRLIGEADLTVRHLLDTALFEAAARTADDADIIVDLSSLAFADASAVEALLLAASRLDKKRSIVVRSPTPTVRKVLTILGWDSASGLRAETDPEPGGAP
ncbi:STAS domain-containing protein [Streptacidiphilus sp. PAMC 29251]